MTATQSGLRPVEVQRDRWQRPLVIPPGGGKPVPYTRCTTYIDVLEDKYNLQKWMQRMVAVGLGTRQDLHLSVASMASDPEGNKASLDRLCESAIEAAKASAKATIGTALHAYIERINRQEDPGLIPAQYQPHIDAYRQHVLPALGQPRAVERFCVHDGLQVGGTPDLITPLSGSVLATGIPDGGYVCDLKTGPSTLKYGALKVAMQLAIYARSDFYNAETGQRRPHGAHKDKGIVIALDSDTAQVGLHWVDLEAGWEAVQIATEVRHWRKRKDLLSAFSMGDLIEPAIPAPVAAPVAAPVSSPQQDGIKAALLAAIWVSPSREALLDLWEKAGATWTDAHTAAAKQRLQALNN
uniref:PD-(D/E)XK endonuclease-like domain-containing protein n=1 Tax=Dulem virus 32 TaxID=3145750 RepID=A0AAU8B1S0_9CAUD